MPTKSFASYIASRYLFHASAEAFIRVLNWISLLSISLSVAVLIVVMSIMGGFQFELRDKIIGTNAHLNVRSLSGAIDDSDSVLDAIRSLEGVRSAESFAYKQALVQTDSRVSGLLIRGIKQGSESYSSLVEYVKRYDEGHTPLPFESGENFAVPEIVIGKELARNLGVRVGDLVTLLAPEMRVSPVGLAPRFKRFRVSAIYNSGLIEYEASLAYTSLEQAQRFFRMKGAVSGIDVWLDDFNDSTARNIELNKLLRSSDSPIGLFSQAWYESNRTLWEALALEKRVYFLVLLLLIVLASFSVVSGLVMLVLEKKRDIAILRTLGASRSQISSIFRRQGLILGVGGTAIGVGLGLLLTWALKHYGFPLPEGIFPVDTVPVRVDSFDVMAVAACGVVICFLATLYPSFRAASFRPAEVLRHD